jgi:hypothetical protein
LPLVRWHKNAYPSKMISRPWYWGFPDEVLRPCKRNELWGQMKMRKRNQNADSYTSRYHHVKWINQVTIFSALDFQSSSVTLPSVTQLNIMSTVKLQRGVIVKSIIRLKHEPNFCWWI